MKTSTLALACLLFATSPWVQAQSVDNFSLEAVAEDAKEKAASKFELKENRGKFVVLHFLLKTECPYCLRYTHQYTQLAESTSDTLHLFIKPDSERDILAWTKHLAKSGGHKPPTIYRDPDAQLAKRFKIPDGYQFHGQKVHYPALIILDDEGKEVFRYVGINNSDRMPTDDFTKKLDSLRKP